MSIDTEMAPNIDQWTAHETSDSPLTTHMEELDCYTAHAHVIAYMQQASRSTSRLHKFLMESEAEANACAHASDIVCSVKLGM